MAVKEDLRVKKTKKALYDAFMTLLSEKQFEDITVNELCDAAGVRRATFYKHYSDKFDFLTAYVRLLRDRIDRMIESRLRTNAWFRCSFAACLSPAKKAISQPIQPMYATISVAFLPIENNSSSSFQKSFSKCCDLIIANLFCDCKSFVKKRRIQSNKLNGGIIVDFAH
jgi:AcrR family transcriptional regulator